MQTEGLLSEESETNLQAEGVLTRETVSLQERLTEAKTEEEIVVFVCGAVERAGIYRLAADSRLYEAVEQAGGFRADADRDWLNLADTLRDGQKLRIYTLEETAALRGQGCQEQGAEDASSDGGADPYGADDAARSGKININTASREQLMTLPGIGEAKADAMMTYREEHGGFQAIEDIMKISGIKEAVFSKIKDKIIV